MILSISWRESEAEHNRKLAKLNGTSETCYAYIPTQLDNGMIVWLEEYKIEYTVISRILNRNKLHTRKVQIKKGG